jgi:hypothetical protein
LRGENSSNCPNDCNQLECKGPIKVECEGPHINGCECLKVGTNFYACSLTVYPKCVSSTSCDKTIIQLRSNRYPCFDITYAKSLPGYYCPFGLVCCYNYKDSISDFCLADYQFAEMFAENTS